MATLQSLELYLNSLLEPEKYQDYGLNGLQVEVNSKQTIRTIAVAVDSGESVIKAAIAADADCLIVHHGLFWGAQTPLTGPLGRKVAALIRGNCSLYAAHLPLDGNSEVGNAVELARLFGFEAIEPAFPQHGMPIGVRCTVPTGTTFQVLLEKAEALPGFTNPLTLLFGSEVPRTVGIATGSAAGLLPECSSNDIDTFITGEPKQEAYHSARELGLNALFLGHYATETTGVQALAQRLEKDLDISTVFIHEPTGI